MNIRTALKRLNKRTDVWSARAMERILANLDSRGQRPARKHVSVRDLIVNGIRSEKRSP